MRLTALPFAHLISIHTTKHQKVINKVIVILRNRIPHQQEFSLWPKKLDLDQTSHLYLVRLYCSGLPDENIMP